MAEEANTHLPMDDTDVRGKPFASPLGLGLAVYSSTSSTLTSSGNPGSSSTDVRQESMINEPGWLPAFRDRMRELEKVAESQPQNRPVAAGMLITALNRAKEMSDLITTLKDELNDKVGKQREWMAAWSHEEGSRFARLSTLQAALKKAEEDHRLVIERSTTARADDIELQGMICERRSELVRLKGEVDQYTSSLDELQRRKTALDDDNRSLLIQKEIASKELLKQQDAHKATVSNYNSTVVQMQQEISAKQSRLGELVQRLESLQRSNDDAEQRENDLHMELQRQDAELEALTDAKKDEQNTLDKTRQTHAQLLLEHEREKSQMQIDLQGRQEEFEERVKKMELTAEHRQRTLNHLIEIQESKGKEFDNTNDLLVQRKKDLMAFEKSCGEQKTRLEELRQSNESVQKSTHQLQTTKNELDQEIREAYIRHQKVLDESKRVNEESVTTKQGFIKESHDLQEKITSLKASKKAIESQVQTQREILQIVTHNVNLTEKTKSDQSQLAELRAMVNDQMIAKDEARNKADATARRHHEKLIVIRDLLSLQWPKYRILLEKNNVPVDSVERLSQSLNILLKDHRNVEQNFHESIKEADSLRGKNSNLAQQIIVLTNSLAEATGSLTNLGQGLVQHHSTLEDYNTTLSQSIRERDRLHVELSQAKGIYSIAEERLKTIGTLEKNYEETKEELKALCNQKKSNEDRDRGEIFQLGKQLVDSKDKALLEERRLGAAISQLQTKLNDDKETAKHEEKRFNNILSHLRLSKEQLQSELTETKASQRQILHCLTHLIKDPSRQQRQELKELMFQKLHSAVQTINDVKKEGKAFVMMLLKERDTNSAHLATIQNLRREFTGAKQQIQLLEGTKTTLEDRLKDQEAKLEKEVAAKEDISSMMKAVGEEKEDYSQRLMASDQARTFKEGELTSMRARLGELEAEKVQNIKMVATLQYIKSEGEGKLQLLQENIENGTRILEQEKSASTERIRKFEEAIDRSYRTIAERDSDLAQERQRNQRLQSEKDTIQLKFQDMSTEFERCTDRIRAREGRGSDLVRPTHVVQDAMATIQGSVPNVPGSGSLDEQPSDDTDAWMSEYQEAEDSRKHLIEGKERDAAKIFALEEQLRTMQSTKTQRGPKIRVPPSRSTTILGNFHLEEEVDDCPTLINEVSGSLLGEREEPRSTSATISRRRRGNSGTQGLELSFCSANADEDIDSSQDIAFESQARQRKEAAHGTRAGANRGLRNPTRPSECDVLKTASTVPHKRKNLDPAEGLAVTNDTQSTAPLARRRRVNVRATSERHPESQDENEAPENRPATGGNDGRNGNDQANRHVAFSTMNDNPSAPSKSLGPIPIASIRNHKFQPAPVPASTSNLSDPPRGGVDRRGTLLRWRIKDVRSGNLVDQSVPTPVWDQVLRQMSGFDKRATWAIVEGPVCARSYSDKKQTI